MILGKAPNGNVTANLAGVAKNVEMTRDPPKETAEIVIAEIRIGIANRTIVVMIEVMENLTHTARVIDVIRKNVGGIGLGKVLGNDPGAQNVVLRRRKSK